MNTYNPIKYAIPVPTWTPLKPSLRPPMNEAHVYKKRGAPMIVLFHDDLEQSNMVRFGAYESLYSIDLLPYLISFDLNLPSKDDGCEFVATISLRCAVDMPTQLVRYKVTDTRAYLAPIIRQYMIEISQEYYPDSREDRRRAEKELATSMQSLKSVEGFELLSCQVFLALDEQDREHYRKLRQIQHALSHEKAQAELWSAREYNAIERNKISLDFFNELIKQGYAQLVLLYLAKNPNDIRAVTEMLVQQRHQDQNYWFEALVKLRKNDILEEQHLGGVRDYLLAQLTRGNQTEYVLHNIDELEQERAVGE